jgi:hypothetical protein
MGTQGRTVKRAVAPCKVVAWRAAGPADTARGVHAMAKLHLFDGFNGVSGQGESPWRCAII